MKVRKISITTQLIICIIALFLVADIVISIVIYNRAGDILNREIRKNTESIAASTAALIDGEIIASLQPGDEETEKYLEVSYLLTDILNASGVEYLYIVRYAADGSLEYCTDAQIED